jgi:hypothetical protein
MIEAQKLIKGQMLTLNEHWDEYVEDAKELGLIGENQEAIYR